MPRLKKSAVPACSPEPATSVQPPNPEFLGTLAKGLALLREFASGVPCLTVQEAAKRLDISRAAARRLLITLEAEGYLCCEGYNYLLTPRVLDLGFAYYASMSLPRLAQSTLQTLCQQLGEAVSLGVWDDDHVVIVARQEPMRLLRVNVDIGRRMPAATHSMGRILLAAQSAAAQQAHLSKYPLQAYTTETITDHQQLLSVLVQVEQQGWCIVSGELAEGFCGVSVLVRGSNGRVLAALSTTMVQGKRSVQQLQALFVPPLQAAAQHLQALASELSELQEFKL